MKFNRFHAFGAHLLGSGVVALLSAALVFLVWYPAPFSTASGILRIFLILLAVDVVLGPFITLIVYNPKKKEPKELRRDLMIVVALQLAALMYGLHAVYVARPVYAVYNADRFDLIHANALTEEKLQKVSDARFRQLPLFGPQIISATPPTSAKERNELMFGALTGGDDLPQLPQYYAPYADAKAQVLKRAQAIDALRALNQERGPEIDAIVQRHAARTGGIGFVPLKGKAQDLAVIVALDSAEVLEITTLKPW